MSYSDKDEFIYNFVSFQQDIKTESTSFDLLPDELDTIVVPAREEGFKETFLGENCWYAIRMSSSMKD